MHETDTRGRIRNPEQIEDFSAFASGSRGLWLLCLKIPYEVLSLCFDIVRHLNLKWVHACCHENFCFSYSLSVKIMSWFEIFLKRFCCKVGRCSGKLLEFSSGNNRFQPQPGYPLFLKGRFVVVHSSCRRREFPSVWLI